MGGGGIYVQLPYTVINVWRINVWVEGAFRCSYRVGVTHVCRGHSRVGVTHVWDEPPKWNSSLLDISSNSARSKTKIGKTRLSGILWPLWVSKEKFVSLQLWAKLSATIDFPPQGAHVRRKGIPRSGTRCTHTIKWLNVTMNPVDTNNSVCLVPDNVFEGECPVGERYQSISGM